MGSGVQVTPISQENSDARLCVASWVPLLCVREHAERASTLAAFGSRTRCTASPSGDRRAASARGCGFGADAIHLEVPLPNFVDRRVDDELEDE